MPTAAVLAAISDNPVHLFIELGLLSVIAYLAFSRRLSAAAANKNREPKLTHQQQEELIAEWQPEPLVPADTVLEEPYAQHQIEGKATKTVRIEGKDYLNLASTNFLGFIGDERIETVAKKTIAKYGVGSCGPRAFYGTVDVHLDLEKSLAKFVGTEEAVLYSYGFATVASAIPAYAKRGDVVFADKGVSFAIQKGLQASCSRVEWFEHNDVADLERLLIAQAEKDKQNPKLAAKTRRFMVVEGLYANSADLCPLPELLALKWKYKVRIFIDESLSFGTVGATGRGVTEHFGVGMDEVDMQLGSLENALASTGGWAAGRAYVVSHHRLAGLGYCFSASLPPLLATAANQALELLDAEPARVARLQDYAQRMHQFLEEDAFRGTGFRVDGAQCSPLKHVRHAEEAALDRLTELLFAEHSIFVQRARYLDYEETHSIEPSIRICVQSELTDEELTRALGAISAAAKKANRAV